MAASRIEKKPHPFGEIDIVLDIDRTIAMPFDNDDLLPHRRILNWFKDNNLYIEASVKHLLYPGTLEFIRYLFSIPNANVHFYSAGSQSRNMPFVKQLLKRALGQAQYEVIKEKTQIFSTQEKENLAYERSVFAGKYLLETFGINIGKDDNPARVKDLFRLQGGFSPSKSLANTILIDDNPAYLASCAQVSNLLIVPRNEELFYSIPAYQSQNGLDHIYYLVGLLEHAIQLGGHSLAGNLFHLQYEKTAPLKYHSIADQLALKSDYYHRGLLRLRKINPYLNFSHELLKSVHEHIFLDAMYDAISSNTHESDSEELEEHNILDVSTLHFKS